MNQNQNKESKASDTTKRQSENDHIKNIGKNLGDIIHLCDDLYKEITALPLDEEKIEIPEQKKFELKQIISSISNKALESFLRDLKELDAREVRIEKYVSEKMQKE